MLSFDDATQTVTNEIFNSPFKISRDNYLVAKLIATWQRETIITDILNQEEKIPIVILGILRGTERLLWAAKYHKINFYYIDHSYFFRADKHKKNKTTNDWSYRACLNQENLNFLVHDKLNLSDINRIQKNKNLLLPRSIIKTTGNKILICPPS